MQARLTGTATIAGLSATLSQTRTKDAAVGANPTCPPADAGTLTTRTSATAGIITCTAAPEVATGQKAILTWTDTTSVRDPYKHRYNVDVTVAVDGANYTVTFSGGSGDDLPDEDSTVNVAQQITVELAFDFDYVDTFVVTTNVRGVVVFLDSLSAEKCVIDMPANGFALWILDTGFPAPISGTATTTILVGSGDTSTTSFIPKVLALYDSTSSGGA